MQVQDIDQNSPYSDEKPQKHWTMPTFRAGKDIVLKLLGLYSKLLANHV